MKVPILSRLEIGSWLSFVVVAGNSNRGVSIRFWKLDGSEVTASVGRVPGLARTHRQECLCHLVESEIAFFLRLGILSKPNFLSLTMNSNSRFAIRSAVACIGVCSRNTRATPGRSIHPTRLAADSVVCVVIIKRSMVAQCFRFAYVKLAILEAARRSRRVPKWNRERERAHDEEGVVVATPGWSGGDGILRNASVRLARNGEMC
jgi:hypothetical protein